MEARRAAALMLVPLVAAAGCGGDSKDDSTEPNRVESKPPREALDDAAAALRRVESFHLEGRQGSGEKSTRIKADVGLPSKLRLAIARGSASASILVFEDSVYIKANSAFWRQQQTGRAASALADRWFKTPSSRGELREITKELDPAVLSRCLVEDHGTLARGGTATVAGQRAVVIVDKGDRPGTAPGKLFVAATGPPLPLRMIATGRERPGGTKDPQCDGDSAPTQAGDEVRLSKYNEPLDVAAPPAAVDLGGGTAS
jgi:hypothetical protein